MKKLIILFAMLFMVSLLQAQTAERTSAWNYLNKGKLDKAKASIDKAIAHPSTMNDAKTWYYKGNVYLALRLTEDSSFRKLEPNALSIAHEAYQKALELDTKKEYFEDIMQRYTIVGEQYYNLGVEGYQAKRFPDAMMNFEKTVQINKMLGKVDTMAMYNVAYVSELAGDFPKAIQYYQNLLQLGYKQPLIYTSLSNIFKSEKDTAMAIEYIKRGRVLFPDDFNVLITETNLYLAKNDIKNAQKNLNQAIEKDPLNPTIHFAVGTTWDQMNRPEEAELAYKKAIELKPDYFDPIYNLGALYFNKGVKIFEEADKLPPGPQYDAEKLKFEDAWKKALPMLEKAEQMQPNDINTVVSLKQLYARLGMPDKLKLINEKLDQLENK